MLRRSLGALLGTGLLMAWVLISSSCGRKGNVTGDDGPDIRAIKRALATIALGINRKEILLSSNYFAQGFQIDPDIQVRFMTPSSSDPENPPTGPADPNIFFKDFWDSNENFSLTILPFDVTVDGNIAVLHGSFDLSALFLLSDPPTNYVSRSPKDLFLFRFLDGIWKLYRWQEVKTEGEA